MPQVYYRGLNKHLINSDFVWEAVWATGERSFSFFSMCQSLGAVLGAGDSLCNGVQDKCNGEKSPGDVGGRIYNITETLWETQPCRGQKHMCKGPGAGMCQVWRILIAHEALPSPATADLPPHSYKSCPLFPCSLPSSGHPSLHILCPPPSALLLWVLAYGEFDLTSQSQEDPILWSHQPPGFSSNALRFSYQVLSVWLGGRLLAELMDCLFQGPEPCLLSAAPRD